MLEIHVNSTMSDRDRLEKLYAGALFVYSATATTREFCAFADNLIRDAFDGLDPELAQHELDVERYVEILAELKPHFIHHPESKRFLQRILIERGCEPEISYFDVPRMRTSTSDGYLTSGLAYAWHPHRDTWFSAPSNQINWWTPIYPVTEGNAMSMFPQYFDKLVPNDSDIYDYADWNANHRFAASDNVKVEARPLPRPNDPIGADEGFPIVSEVGGLLLFSAAHMHASIANNTGKTRFSIDFRTANLDDSQALRGAPVHDVACTHSSIRDFLNVADLEQVPEQVAIAMIETTGQH